MNDRPVFLFALSFFVLWLSARIGAFFRKRRVNLEEESRQEIDVVAAATLTLLGLLIGFSFSMAISRYDQRKIYEEDEANSIGTEYVRADLPPAGDAAKVRALLKDYLDQRVLFYEISDEQKLRQINEATARLQTELWSAVLVPAAAEPTPVRALAVSGMNDLLNSQGYTQAAWWNRIPIAAWGLMAAIALCSTMLVGYRAHGAEVKVIQFLVLPFVLSIAFFLIAEIDSPRRGIIRVRPQNLLSLVQSLHAQ